MLVKRGPVIINIKPTKAMRNSLKGWTIDNTEPTQSEYGPGVPIFVQGVFGK